MLARVIHNIYERDCLGNILDHEACVTENTIVIVVVGSKRNVGHGRNSLTIVQAITPEGKSVYLNKMYLKNICS